jgi:hypothetical protein
MQNIHSKIQKILLREDNYLHIRQIKVMCSNALHPIIILYNCGICAIIGHNTLLSGNYCRVSLFVENYLIVR